MKERRDFSIANLRLLGDARAVEPGGIAVEDGRIARLRASDGAAVDGCGLLALPGIVDLHGDSFERQLMPRPGISFGTAPALVDTDRQLLANGITTAYHGLTLSWEPGLRGREAGSAFIDAFQAIRPLLGCDTRLHLRFELYNLDAVDDVLRWIEEKRIDLLAFNEHTQDTADKIAAGKSGGFTGRSGLDERQFTALLQRVRSRAAEVPPATERLAAAARRAGIPLASHDDNTPAERAHFHALGCRICEFPKDEPTARAALEAGDGVVMGAPNILRGGSHTGRLSVREAVAGGFCSALTSDYYYPSLLLGAFALVRDGIAALPDAWALVSSRPAALAGLHDRGVMAAGCRADFILVDDRDPALPRVAAAIVGGSLRYAADGFSASLAAMG